jgi:hypothetical protein
MRLHHPHATPICLCNHQKHCAPDDGSGSKASPETRRVFHAPPPRDRAPAAAPCPGGRDRAVWLTLYRIPPCSTTQGAPWAKVTASGDAQSCRSLKRAKHPARVDRKRGDPQPVALHGGSGAVGPPVMRRRSESAGSHGGHETTGGGSAAKMRVEAEAREQGHELNRWACCRSGACPPTHTAGAELGRWYSRSWLVRRWGVERRYGPVIANLEHGQDTVERGPPVRGGGQTLVFARTR